MSISTETSVPLLVETRYAARPPGRVRPRRRLLIAGGALVVLVAVVGLLRPIERLKSLFGRGTDDAAVYTVKPVTLFSSFKSFTFRLWDEQRRRLVGYSALRAIRNPKGQAGA